MSRFNSITLGVLLASLVTGDAAAQWNVGQFSTARRHVYTTFGLDPAFVTSVGLSSVGTLMERDVQVSGEVGLVTASVDAHDFRTRLGVQTTLYRWRALRLTGSAVAIARGTENSVYRGINFGADFTGALGVYRPRWFASGEFGKDKAVITHVTHSDWYRTNFYADAKDGWYLNGGGTYHYGLTGGMSLGRTELMARLGILRTERFNQMTPPAYASIGVGFGY